MATTCQRECKISPLQLCMGFWLTIVKIQKYGNKKHISKKAKLRTLVALSRYEIPDKLHKQLWCASSGKDSLESNWRLQEMAETEMFCDNPSIYPERQSYKHTDRQAEAQCPHIFLSHNTGDAQKVKTIGIQRQNRQKPPSHVYFEIQLVTGMHSLNLFLV